MTRDEALTSAINRLADAVEDLNNSVNLSSNPGDHSYVVRLIKEARDIAVDWGKP